MTYCEGWDPDRKTVVRAIPAALAEARDAAGEPYAVLLSGTVKPFAFIQVHRQAGYMGVFQFDDEGRRVAKLDYRQLDADALHLREFKAWGHLSADEAEFESAVTFTVTIEPDGRARKVLDAHGSFHTTGTVPAEHHRIPPLRFGYWPFDGESLTPPTDFDFVDADDPPQFTDTTSGEPTWSAPTGLRPRHLEALFTPGARFKQQRDGQIAQIAKPEQVGLVRLPTGRIIAADPCCLDIDRTLPFTVTVPPGAYPMLVASINWQGNGWGEVTAAKLQISEQETVTWELALQPQQEPRLLGAGQFYGFGVDSGTGAFLDASGCEALERAVEDHWSQQDGAPQPQYPQISDESTGTNLFIYSSGGGDGSYPVWIGRDAAGEVTCFVADMLVLNDAELLSGPTSSATRFVEGVSAVSPISRSTEHAPVFQPGATGRFLVNLCTEAAQMRQRINSPFQAFNRAE